MFVSAYLYLNWQIRKKQKANGEHFEPSEGEDLSALEVVNNGNVPSITNCFIPIVILLALMFGLQFTAKIPSAYAVAIAMAVAILAGCVLYRDFLDPKKAICDSAGGGLGSFDCDFVHYGDLVLLFLLPLRIAALRKRWSTCRQIRLLPP